MVPAPNCFGNCPNPGGIYVNAVMGGCPPSHPNSQPPNCAPPQPPVPGITPNFTNNIQSGFNSFGCQFVYKRTSVQSAKLLLLQHSINPNSTLGQQLEPILIDYGNGVLQGPPPPSPPPPPPIPNPNNPIPYPGTPIPAPMIPNFASFGGWSNQTGVAQKANTGGTSLPPGYLGLLPVNNLYMQAWNIFSGGIQPAGSVGKNANWQQLLQNRINWLNNFALQNCTGGPTPPPPTPPNPGPTPPPPYNNTGVGIGVGIVNNGFTSY